MALSLDRPVPLSKLDAVNLVLRAIGKATTARLGQGARGEAQDAEAALSTALLEVLQDEWSFNKDDSLKLSRNTDGEIYLPENLLSFEVTGESEHLDVTQRGSRLYDRSKSSFRFDQDVYVSATLALSYEDLPQPARWYIAVKAAFDFANQKVPGDASIRPSSQQVEAARISLDRFDNKLRGRNMRAENPHFKRLRGGR